MKLLQFKEFKGVYMKSIISSILIIGAISYAQCALSDCNFPNMNINFPDGSKASKQEMLEAQKKINATQSGLIAYRDCIDKELKLVSTELENYPEIFRTNMKRHNSAVVAEEKLRDSWSETIRAYKAQ